MSQPVSKLQPKNPATVVPIENLLEQMDSLSKMLAHCALDLMTEHSYRSLDQTEWLQVDVDFLHPYPIEISESKTSITICVRVPGFDFVEVKIGVGLHHLILNARMEQNTYLNDRGFGPKNRRSKEILRLLRIPVSVDKERIAATTKIGMLVISLPKIPTGKLALAFAKTT